MFQIFICPISFSSALQLTFLLFQNWSWFCCCYSCYQGFYWIACIVHCVWMIYFWPGVTRAVYFSIFLSNFTSWFAMIYFADSLNLSSNFQILSNRSVIVVARSGCFTENNFEAASVGVSLEVIGMERVFVEGDMVRNKYWVGLLKFSEVQSLVEWFVYNWLVRN